MAKPRLLLLDADIVITAHSLGIWEQLKAAYEIAVPATIVRELGTSNQCEAPEA